MHILLRIQIFLSTLQPYNVDTVGLQHILVDTLVLLCYWTMLLQQLFNPKNLTHFHCGDPQADTTHFFPGTVSLGFTMIFTAADCESLRWFTSYFGRKTERCTITFWV